MYITLSDIIEGSDSKQETHWKESGSREKHIHPWN